MTYIGVFPGQGSLKVNSLGLLYKQLPDLIELLNIASSILELDFSLALRSNEIKNTLIQQTLVCILSAAYFRHCGRMDIKAVAGHSLGELTACYVAGVFSFEDLLHIVSSRAKFMHDASTQCDGGMMAIIGVDLCLLSEFIGKNYQESIFVANVNLPDQVVVSGKRIDLVQFEHDIKKKFSVVTRQLEVSGPWHSSYMIPAASKFQSLLGKYNFKTPSLDLYLSYSSKKVTASVDIKNNLVQQIATPVYWAQLVNKIKCENNQANFVEVGASVVLKNLIKRSCCGSRVYSVNDGRDWAILKKQMSDSRGFDYVTN